jgi:hypothetical protein
MNGDYYVSRKGQLLAAFDAEASLLESILAAYYGEALSSRIVAQARPAFEALIPGMPYIGGDANVYTSELVRSVRCLALYQAMKDHGKTAAEAGRVLYEAAETPQDTERHVTGPSAQSLTNVELMQRRRERAERSQKRLYPADYVYTLVEGDGDEFDYGYDFTECATQKLYHACGADEFLPYYCFLDFAMSRAAGLGLVRTMTLAAGDARCNHRFKKGRQTEPQWPPDPVRQGTQPLQFSVLPMGLAVCRLEPTAEVPARLLSLSFFSITRTEQEISLVLPETEVPSSWRAERGWRCLRVAGTLDFALVGILASLTATLAKAGISTFVISTYDTDYLLVRDASMAAAVAALESCGHTVWSEGRNDAEAGSSPGLDVEL